MNRELQNKIPEIYCAISLLFEEDADTASITAALSKIGIHDFKISIPKCDPIVCIDIAVIKYEPFWYLDEASTKMFNQVESCISDLKRIIEEFHGRVCIDVAFCQFGTYPALEFSGENMKRIHYLEADISIDPY